MTSSSATSIRLASYQLFERVGEGASAQVFRARGPAGEDVAIKLLAPSAAFEPAARARFDREIAVLAGLSHPHLSRLLDHGVDDELGPYLVTPLVAGSSLRAVGAAGRLSPEAALLLGEAIAAGLAALHDASLTHRDLKPENVLLGPDGDLVVVDLGLALGAGHSRHTEDGAVVGSVPYMAPEQLEGDAAIGPPVDVWAFGVLFYELVCGRRPFFRERASEEAAAALIGRFSPLDAADRRAGSELSALVGQCLAADPAARPDAASLHARVADLIDWCEAEARPGERAAVAADPIGYQDRVADLRVRRLARLACEASDAGKPFVALRLLDRALAYHPDDPELGRLASAAERASASAAPDRSPPANTPDPARRPRPRWLAGAGVGVAALLGLILLLVASDSDDDDPEPAATTTATTAAAKEDMVWSVTGGMLDIFQRQLALEEAKQERQASATEAAASAAGLVPIPLAALENDAPPRPDLELAAAPGQPLVPRELVDGPSPKAVLATLEAELAQKPGDRDLRLGHAMVTLAASIQRIAGLRALDQIGRDFPDDAVVWAVRGYIETRRGRYDAADRALSRAIALDPRDSKSLTNRGILRHRRGRIRDGYVDLTAALAVDPGDVDALSELTQIYERAGRRRDALPILERIVRARPGWAAAWIDLSLAQAPDDALVSLRRALSIEPESARGLARLCTVQAQRQDPAAVDACTRAIARSPVDADSYMHRGLARYQGGDSEAALVDLDRAIAMAPERATFYTNRYLVRRHAGHPGARDDLLAGCELGAAEACTELEKLPE